MAAGGPVGGDSPGWRGRVVLVPYDDRWPGLYAREEARVRAALGADVLCLEHVGSTAVQGLAAKPIIDMLLVVADSADEEAYLARLEAAGYLLRVREPEWYEHRMCVGPDGVANLHVFSRGCVEVAQMVRFRDRLRAEDRDRALYERFKLELATESWRSVQHYAEAKTDVIRVILARDAASRS